MRNFLRNNVKNSDFDAILLLPPTSTCTYRACEGRKVLVLSLHQPRFQGFYGALQGFRALGAYQEFAAVFEGQLEAVVAGH